jgi:hypothetical protein
MPTNPKTTFYPINSDAGAFTVIRLTTFAKYVEICEDPNYNEGEQQGLQYNILDPFALSSNITRNAQPAPPDYGIVLAFGAAGTTLPPGAFQAQLTFGDIHNVHSGTEMPLGNPGSAGNVDNPGGVATLGTPLVQLRTNSANAGGVVVREWA